MPTTIIMAPADLLSVRLHASEAQRRCDRITRAVADAMHEALTPERLAYIVVQVRTLATKYPHCGGLCCRVTQS
jgi:hypothetical protein